MDLGVLLNLKYSKYSTVVKCSFCDTPARNILFVFTLIINIATKAVCDIQLNDDIPKKYIFYVELFVSIIMSQQK